MSVFESEDGVGRYGYQFKEKEEIAPIRDRALLLGYAVVRIGHPLQAKEAQATELALKTRSGDSDAVLEYMRAITEKNRLGMKYRREYPDSMLSQIDAEIAYLQAQRAKYERMMQDSASRPELGGASYMGGDKPE